jgi:adhesin/invasin
MPWLFLEHMLARSSGATRRRGGFTLWPTAFVVALFVPTVGWDRVPLTAPTESTITLFATGPSVPVNGSVEIVASVVEESGTPVHNGTVVTFTTTLGRIDPAEARTHNGRVNVRLSSDGRSGTATVTAFSGGAVSEAIDVLIGSAAAETVVVRADPPTLPVGGGSSTITAHVLDASGNGMPDVTVRFTATAGSLSSARVTTNAQGEAQTRLTTSSESTVRASVGTLVTVGQNVAEVAGEVTVRVAASPTLSLTASPPTPTVDQPVTFTVGVTVPAGGSPVRNVRLSFGDGDVVDLGAVSGSTTASHLYEEDDSYTVTATVTDVTGAQTSQSLVVVVLPAPDTGNDDQP